MPVPCRTLRAVGNAATSMLRKYLAEPIVDATDNWVDDDACVSPHHRVCPHGVKVGS